VYVGGGFISAGGITTSRIAVWDSSSATTANRWSPLFHTGTDGSEGVGGNVNALDIKDSILYLGGDFTTMAGGTLPASKVAKYAL
jgi:hypothetical protein